MYEAISSGASAKLLVTEFADSQSRCPANGEGELASSDSTWGTYTHSLTVGMMESGNCGIEIKAANIGIGDIDGQRIWLEFDPQQQQWICNSEIADKYLPANCRG